MLKKEFKEVFKQTLILIISVFFLIYPIYLIASIFNKSTFVFSEYFMVFYQLFILFFSFFLGISLFSKEFRNDGFEYLLTLPFSRTKLLVLKIIPRLTSLTLLYLIYLVLLNTSTSDPFLITPVSFLAVYFSLFFVSTSLSVLRGNFVGNSIFTGMMFILFLAAANFPAWLVIRNYFGTSESFKLRIFTVGDTFPFSPLSIVLLGFLISLPFIISLFYGFLKFDVRSSMKYLKRFLALLIPLLLISVGISYLMLNFSTSDPYTHYYITKKEVVLKWNYSGTYVLDSEGDHRLPDFYLHRRNFYETEHWVYVSVWNRNTNPTGSILRFNQDFSDYKAVYSPPGPRYLSRNLYGHGDTLVFLESVGKKYSWNRSDDNRVVFLNTDSGDVQKFNFPYQGLKLIGVTEASGIKYLIGYYTENMGVTVYTMSQNGKIKKIRRSSMGPVFQQGVLITREKEDLVFGKLEGEHYEETGREKVKEKLTTPYYLHSADLNPTGQSFTIFKIHKKPEYEKMKNPPPLDFISVNLNTLKTRKFSHNNIKRALLYDFASGKQVLFKFNDWGDLTLDALYRVKGDSFVLLRDFSGEKIGGDFWMAGNGFFIGKGENINFYTLPDLKELK